MNWENLIHVFGMASFLWLMAGGCLVSYAISENTEWRKAAIFASVSVQVILFICLVVSAGMDPA